MYVIEGVPQCELPGHSAPALAPYQWPLWLVVTWDSACTMESWLHQFIVVSTPPLWRSTLIVRGWIFAPCFSKVPPSPYSPVLTCFLHLAVPDEVSWAWLLSIPSRSSSPASNISLAFCTYGKRQVPPHGWRILNLISCNFLS